jgi:hypothetical protein
VTSPLYQGDHKRKARALCAAAAADPTTPCGRCGKTLAQHPRTKTGKPPRWHAGHVIDGLKGGPLRPEVDVCNEAAGGRLATRRRSPNAW